MANIRKSFNFRTGLQVDNDNFVVNANGLVGIGTSIPQNYLLNVHGDTRVTGLVTTGTLQAGLGTITTLNATDANVSGVLTASSLRVGSSSVISNLVGYGYTAWITNDGGVGLHTLSRVGIGTDATPTEQLKVFGDVAITTSLTVGSATTIASYGINSPSGIITASSFSGSLNATDLTSGTVNNARLPSNISVSGIVTATGGFVGDVTGTATTASSLTGSPNITVTDVSASNVSSGVITATTELNVGSDGTALTALSTGRLGIGTALPTSEIQVRKASGSLVEVVSDSGEARISIGNSVGVGNSSALLRFGNNSNDFDIINYDIGDIRNILGSSTNPSTGSFKWIDGDVNAERMTLTYDGNLGINDTTPSQRLSVGGGATITGNVHIVSNLTVGGNITGTISYPSVITGTNLNNTGGITTLSKLKVTESIDFDSIPTIGIETSVGIGTTLPFSYDGSPVGLTVKNTLNANTVVVDHLLAMPSGIITASTVSANFNSSNSTDSAVSITVLTSPNRIVFQVVGTSLTATLNLS